VADDDVPEISIAAGSGITEDSAATFTVTATPAPAADLAVTIEVSQSGSFAQAGSRTVTIFDDGSRPCTASPPPSAGGSRSFTASPSPTSGRVGRRPRPPRPPT